MPPAVEWKQAAGYADYWRLVDNRWKEVLAAAFPKPSSDTFEWLATSVQSKGETWTLEEAKQEAEEALGITEAMKLLDPNSLEAKVRRCWYPANPEPVLDVHDKASLAEQVERERERCRATKDLHLLLGGPRHLDVVPICGARVEVLVPEPRLYRVTDYDAPMYTLPEKRYCYNRQRYRLGIRGRLLGELRLGILDCTSSERVSAMLKEAGIDRILDECFKG